MNDTINQLQDLWRKLHPGGPPPSDDLDELHEQFIDEEEDDSNTTGGLMKKWESALADSPEMKSLKGDLERVGDFPNGPLIPVSEEQQAKKVAQTASEQWGIPPQHIESVATIDDLVQLVRSAQATNKPIRFVGSARSLSRAPQPPADGSMGATCRFQSELALETNTFRTGTDTQKLYSAEAGRVLANVLIDLDKGARALANMGSGDFQALAGAISTATHGSGVAFSALPGAVRSMDVVTVVKPARPQEVGTVVKQRIEPTQGITDPEKFKIAHKNDGLELIQDDEIFDAWKVSLGCLGAIFSVVVDVEPEYWLHETRNVEWWSEVKTQMPHDLNKVNYYEILVDPLPTMNGSTPDNKCLVTRRQLVNAPPNNKHQGGRPWTMAVAQTGVGRFFAGLTLARSLRSPLARVPELLNLGVTATQVSGYTDKWYKVLLLRMDINANSAEIGVPLGGGGAVQVDPSRAIDATDEILSMAAANQVEMSRRLPDKKNPFLHAFEELLLAWKETPLHTSPISLRFVSSASEFMSMQFGEPTCMIEMPMPGNDTYQNRLLKDPERLDKNGHRRLKLYQAYSQGRQTLFQQVQTKLAQYAIRPHWGQTNFMTWADTMKVYPSAGKWKALYDTANRDGVFNNPLTDQLGISIDSLPLSAEHASDAAATPLNNERKEA
jgi:hypothetical protein